MHTEGPNQACPKSYPHDRIYTQVIYRFALAQVLQSVHVSVLLMPLLVGITKPVMTESLPISDLCDTLTVCLLVSSDDNFCKQFGSRSGPTRSRSKLFDTLMVFLKDVFENKNDSENITNIDDKKHGEKTTVAK